MSDHLNEIVLVGAGKMAKAYAKALIHQHQKFIVVGRSEERIMSFKEDFPEIHAVSGGIEDFLKKEPAPKFAIVAANITVMASIAQKLIEAGARKILLEKPGSLSIKVLSELKKLAEERGASVFIGYNRRFYTSVLEAQRIIEEDGGLSSFHFEFTEMIHKIKPEKHGPEALSRWVISNSSHVIDTAFFLGGAPKELMGKVSGNDVEWHPSGSIFTGMGETEKGVPFTYHANWGSAGRWSLEVNTSKRKLIFSPMERLKCQLKGETAISEVELDYSKDENYKPGIFGQTYSFINYTTTHDLLDIGSLIEELRWVNKIAKY